MNTAIHAFVASIAQALRLYEAKLASPQTDNPVSHSVTAIQKELLAGFLRKPPPNSAHRLDQKQLEALLELFEEELNDPSWKLLEPLDGPPN